MANRVKQRMVGARLLQSLPILVLATFIVFCLMQLIPGDVAVTLAGRTPPWNASNRSARPTA